MRRDARGIMFSPYKALAMYHNSGGGVLMVIWCLQVPGALHQGTAVGHHNIMYSAFVRFGTKCVGAVML